MKDSPHHNNNAVLFKGWSRDNIPRKVLLIIVSILVLSCLILPACDSKEDVPEDFSRLKGVSQNNVFENDHPAKAPQRFLENENEAKLKIVAFGDSLTAGLGVSVDQSYPGQLQRKIQEAGYPYDVVNAGVSGETTAGGVRRVEWILKSRPAIVILELGANDGLRGQPLDQSYRNLQTIIKRFQEEGVVVVLAGMKMPLNYGEAYTQEFERMFSRLAEEFQIPLIPFLLKGVAAERTLNQSDGIHPTAEGYTIVVGNVWKVLEPILEQRAGKASQSHTLPVKKLGA